MPSAAGPLECSGPPCALRSPICDKFVDFYFAEVLENKATGGEVRPPSRGAATGSGAGQSAHGVGEIARVLALCWPSAVNRWGVWENPMLASSVKWLCAGWTPVAFGG